MSVRVIATLVLVALAMPAHGTAQIEPAAHYIAAIEAAQPTDDTATLAGLTLPELMERFNVPGVSVAVIRDFEIHWAKGYGVADVVTSAPVDTGTIFQAASISKPVAAMAVLRAVQDGLFSLDDDINDILESWQLDGEGFTADRPVTPRTLTSHTSGLGDGFGFPGYHPDLRLPTVVQILEGHELSNVRRVFMQRPPLSATYSEATASGRLNVIQSRDLRALIAAYYFDAGRFGSTIDERIESGVERFTSQLERAGLSPAARSSADDVIGAMRGDATLIAALKNVRYSAAFQIDRHAVIHALASDLIAHISSVVGEASSDAMRRLERGGGGAV